MTDLVCIIYGTDNLNTMYSNILTVMILMLPFHLVHHPMLLMLITPSTVVAISHHFEEDSVVEQLKKGNKVIIHVLKYTLMYTLCVQYTVLISPPPGSLE